MVVLPVPFFPMSSPFILALPVEPQSLLGPALHVDLQHVPAIGVDPLGLFPSQVEPSLPALHADSQVLLARRQPDRPLRRGAVVAEQLLPERLDVLLVGLERR